MDNAINQYARTEFAGICHEVRKLGDDLGFALLKDCRIPQDYFRQNPDQVDQLLGVQERFHNFVRGASFKAWLSMTARSDIKTLDGLLGAATAIVQQADFSAEVLPSTRPQALTTAYYRYQALMRQSLA